MYVIVRPVLAGIFLLLVATAQASDVRLTPSEQYISNEETAVQSSLLHLFDDLRGLGNLQKSTQSSLDAANAKVEWLWDHFGAPAYGAPTTLGDGSVIVGHGSMVVRARRPEDAVADAPLPEPYRCVGVPEDWVAVTPTGIFRCNGRGVR